MSLNYSFDKDRPSSKPKSMTYYDTDGHTRNISFAQADGTKLFLNYAYLISGAFSPNESTITLTFTTHLITLKGHNLSPVCDGLAAQSIQRITIVEERYAGVEEGVSFVTQMTVQQI